MAIETLARTMAASICWINVGLCTIDLGFLAYARLRGFAVDPLSSIWRLFGFAWNLLWAIYLGGEKTCAAFQAPARA